MTGQPPRMAWEGAARVGGRRQDADPRGVAQRVKHPVGDRSDQVAVLLAGHALDLDPLGVGQEGRPGLAHRRLVGPGQQVDELSALVAPALPYRHDHEAVAAHQSGGVVAKTGVESRLVVLVNLVDPQLMAHSSCLSLVVPVSYRQPSQATTWAQRSGSSVSPTLSPQSQ